MLAREIEPPGRLGLLVGVAVWLLVAGYLLPFASRTWIPHDDGLLGQLGERALAGELPHRDFDDPYTGGLSWLYAAAFGAFGVRLMVIRWILLASALAAVPFLYALCRRFLGPLAAGATTFVAMAWSVPNYFAGLPSWYNLWLAVPALWCLVRHGEEGRRRWLFLAGLAAGLSCLIKISGLFLLAAVLLTIVHGAFGSRGGAENRGSRGRLLRVLATLSGVVFTLLLLKLVGPLLRGATGTAKLSVLGHFVLPGVALAAHLASRAWRTMDADRVVIRRVVGRALVALSGWAIPVGVLVAVYARASALPDLGHGLFVLPQMRFAHTAMSVPAAWSLLIVLPLALLMMPPRGLRRAVRFGLAIACALVLGAVLVLAARPAIYSGIWLLLRALVPATVLIGLMSLRRQSHAPERQTLFAVLTTLAMVSLIQVPVAYGIYFFYVAPLAVLGVAMVAATTPRALRGTVAVIITFLGAFALLWLNGGDPLTVGWQWREARADERLDVDRGGIFIRREEAAVYQRLVDVVRSHATAEQPIWAAPDCPEVYFLTGRANPTRTFFDFFAPGYTDPDRLLAQLDAWQVPVVVINQRPGFSPLVPSATVKRIAVRFPNSGRIGPFLVFWRNAPATNGPTR